MKRPYVICHILASLDGKINGPFMSGAPVAALAQEYGKIREEMEADALLYGTSTTKEFTGFAKPVYSEDVRAGIQVPEGDFVAVERADNYYVSVDTAGEIGWESGTFSNRGRKAAHVIELLTEATPVSYRAYLREKGVSYLLAGKEKLDCRLAMEKLYGLFSIRKLLICGGGMADWSFLSAGMVDELSLVLAPVSDGSSGSASLFSKLSSSDPGGPVTFTLDEVRRLGDGGLYLKYLAQNAVEREPV